MILKNMEKEEEEEIMAEKELILDKPLDRNKYIQFTTYYKN